MKSETLARKYKEKNPRGHFFDPKTMRFFGDTFENYGVRELEKYYELFRKKPVKNGLKSSAYFDKETFKRAHPQKMLN